MTNKNVHMSMKIYLGNDDSYSSNLSYAHKYAKLGWAVFPIYQIEEGVCSCPLGKSCKSAGKHPRTKTGLKEATTNKEAIDAWWDAYPNANIGIRTGPESGIWVLDVDIDHENGKLGDNSLELLEDLHGSLPSTVEAITGGGGRHLFFKYPSNQ
ncbi:MAG: bifunctional DNA primase/polymerase, partial [Kordiimonadaceae bacterium]|nr:bifunctional DNA primase/polymerase [Kordiimonadaceae bacterium]